MHGSSILERLLWHFFLVFFFSWYVICVFLFLFLFPGCVKFLFYGYGFSRDYGRLSGILCACRVIVRSVVVPRHGLNSGFVV